VVFIRENVGGNTRLFRLTKGTECLWFDQSVETLTQNGDALFVDRPSAHLNNKISVLYNTGFFLAFLLF